MLRKAALAVHRLYRGKSPHILIAGQICESEVMGDEIQVSHMGVCGRAFNSLFSNFDLGRD